MYLNSANAYTAHSRKVEKSFLLYNKMVICSQMTSERYVQNKQREEQRDTAAGTGPSLSFSLVWFSLSLSFSRKPLHSHQGFPTFPVFCRSELWEIISVRLLADCTQKAALESVFLLRQRLKSNGWLFFFFSLPQPQRGTHNTPHYY